MTHEEKGALSMVDNPQLGELYDEDLRPDCSMPTPETDVYLKKSMKNWLVQPK